MKYILEAVEFGKYKVFPEDKKNISLREKTLIEKWVTKSVADRIYKEDGYYYYYYSYGRVSPYRCDKISEIPQIFVDCLSDVKSVKQYEKEFLQHLVSKGLFTKDLVKYLKYQSDDFVDMYIDSFIDKTPQSFANIKNPNREQIIKAIKINPNIVKYCDSASLTDDLIEMAKMDEYKTDDSYYAARAKFYGEKLTKSEREQFEEYLDDWATSRVRKYNGLYYFIDTTRNNYKPRGFVNPKDVRYDVVRCYKGLPILKTINDLIHLNKIDIDFLKYLDESGVFRRVVDGYYTLLISKIPTKLKTREFYDFYMDKFIKEHPKDIRNFNPDKFDHDKSISLNPNVICFFPLRYRYEGTSNPTEEEFRKLVRKAMDDKRFDFTYLKQANDEIFNYIDEDFAIKNFDKCPYLIQSISEENQTEEMGEKAFTKINATRLNYIKKIPEDVLIQYAHEFIYTSNYLKLSDKLKTPKFNLAVVRRCRADRFLHGSIFNLPKELLSSNDYIIALETRIKEDDIDKLVEFFNLVPKDKKRDVLEYISKNKHSLIYHLKINDDNKEVFKWLVETHPDTLKYVKKNKKYMMVKAMLATKQIKENFSEEEEDEILYIFDFDDTLVKTPRFEDLAIPLLEKVTIEDMLKLSCGHIGVDIGDLKHDNGRIYVNDPDEEIEIKGNWVRKKKRVYLLAPYTFHLSDDSFPKKLKKLSKLYKEVENKAIVTGRPSKVKSKVIKSLLDLGLELPRFGVHCYPLDDDNSDRVATWKAKKIIQLIKKTEIYNVKFYDDNRKWLRKVKEIINEELPNVNLETIRVY